MSIPETRVRPFYFGNVGGTLRSINNYSENRIPLQGVQRTTSWNWQNYAAVRRAFGRYNSVAGRTHSLDTGHSFLSRRDFYISNSGFRGRLDSIAMYGGRPMFSFEGVIVASKPDWTAAALKATASSSSSLDAFGTTAIAKVRPTKPQFDAAVNIAELIREGLPKMVGTSLLKDRAKDLRKTGDEWLNFQFGIQPLVSGIQDGFKTVSQAEKLLTQIERDSGRVIRRRFIDDPKIEVIEEKLPSRLPVGCSTSYLVGTPRELTRVTKIQRQRWFSGAFTYHLPPCDGYDVLRRTAKKAEMLYGLRVNPEVIWNLLPWSWAADWVANAGDVVANITAFSSEGLVMRYGYVMETTTVTVTDSISVPRSTGFGTDVLSHSYGTTVKVRRRATPYGFGLNENAFSAYQWGIIGALGISNAPKRLR